ncbi:hypothetical protein MMC22_006219 [Lobaria immixta]|nr:hypothetical protein [Lobaria immixta]
MSHYISALLIGPVVRQARRFSRPNSESEPARAHPTRAENRQDIDATSIHHGHTLAAAPAHEIQHHRGLETGDPLADVTNDFEVLMPDFEAGGLEADLQAWTSRRGLASPLRRADSAPEIERRTRPPRRYTRHTEAGSSNNPLYGASESLGSTNSSTSSSLASATDMNMTSPDDSRLSLRTTAQDASGGVSNYGNRIGDGSLPADDGMGHMRHKILAIQEKGITNAEKARMIHELMTERYMSSQTGLQASRLHRQHSPSSFLSSDRPVTPASSHSVENTMQSASPPTSMSSVPESTNPFHLTLDDLRPTYFSKRQDIHGATGEDVRMDNQRFGSTETVEEPKVLGCAHYKRNIKLQCSACDRWYTLLRRNALNAANEGPGTTAVSVSYGMTIRRKAYTIATTAVYVELGKDLARTFIIARRAVRSIVNMEMQFRHLERAIESQPMPPQFEDTKAFVYCNDCSAKTTVKYHWLGLKCAVCDSYNTAQIQILSGPDPERVPSEVSETPLNSEILSPLSPLFLLSSSINDASPRGRIMHAGTHRRLTTSASAAERTHTTTHGFSLRRTARSESPNIHINLAISPATTSESDPNDSMDTDEDYSDVDFWGRESPSGRLPSPSQNRTLRNGDSSDEDEYDDDDDDEDDNDQDMSDEVDIEEGDEGDRMEIFGHR